MFKTKKLLKIISFNNRQEVFYTLYIYNLYLINNYAIKDQVSKFSL